LDCRRRWQERAAKGMTEDELAKALVYEIGADGGSGGPAEVLSLVQAATGCA